MTSLRGILVGSACMLALGLSGERLGSAFQRGTPPPPPPPYSPPTMQWPGMKNPDGRMSDTPMEDGMRRQMESKRMRMMSADRQKLMTKEADQIVREATDLQASLSTEQQGAQRDEALRRVETIERLARSVKERMKGDR